jgi:FkbM family methyltransferase
LVTAILRTILPLNWRIRLRRSSVARWALRQSVGGIRSKPIPGLPFRLFYDGYRNVNFDARDLGEPERIERERTMEFLRRRPPRVVWDVGANIGFWSLYLSAAFPDLVEHRCFEPDPTNLQLLRRNRDENHLRWVIRPVGLSDRAGTAKFYADEETGATGTVERDADFIGLHYGLKRKETTVELSTIDAEVAAGAAPPDFMKVDVEGHELAMFRGGRETLRRVRPLIVFECTRDHGKVATFLRDLDYRLLDMQGQPCAEPGYYTLAVPPDPAFGGA